MNCPTCKNPLTNSITNCEWCGSNINIESKSFNAYKTSWMLFIGTLYEGYFEGKLNVGQKVTILYKNEVIEGVVERILTSQAEFIDSYEGKSPVCITIY
jgi:hypothetical protein